MKQPKSRTGTPRSSRSSAADWTKSISYTVSEGLYTLRQLHEWSQFAMVRPQAKALRERVMLALGFVILVVASVVLLLYRHSPRGAYAPGRGGGLQGQMGGSAWPGGSKGDGTGGSWVPPWVVSRADVPGWLTLHEHFVELSVTDNSLPVNILFLGDAITEGWREMSLGHMARKYRGVRGVFESEIGAWSRSLNFGIAGDKAENVFWRLANGELSNPAFAPAVCVLHAGTENLVAGEPPHHVADKVKHLVTFLRRARPKSQVLVMGILPTAYNHSAHVTNFGDNENQGPSVRPEPGVVKLNTFLKHSLNALGDSHVQFLDCSQRFVSSGGVMIRRYYQTDMLGLSLKGYRALAPCFRRTLERMAGVREDESDDDAR